MYDCLYVRFGAWGASECVAGGRRWSKHVGWGRRWLKQAARGLKHVSGGSLLRLMSNKEVKPPVLVFGTEQV